MFESVQGLIKLTLKIFVRIHNHRQFYSRKSKSIHKHFQEVKGSLKINKRIIWKVEKFCFDFASNKTKNLNFNLFKI